MIDELSLARGRTGLGQGLSPGQHIDQRTLAHVGPPNEGVLRPVRFGTFLPLGTGLDELRVVNRVLRDAHTNRTICG